VESSSDSIDIDRQTFLRCREYSWVISMQLLPFLSCSLVGIGFISLAASPAFALPPASDLPEEYLRAQIILEARSPQDGDVIAAGEYADLMANQEKEEADRVARAVFIDQYEKEPDRTPTTSAEIYRGRSIYTRTPPKELAARKNTPRELIFLLRLRKIFSTLGLQINLK
jgi:hypothetical protein